jgi:hypothetical protein
VIRKLIEWRTRKHQMAWGHPLIRLPFGIRMLALTNGGWINVISRHPKGSITWTFQVWVKGWHVNIATQKPMWRLTQR